MDQGKILGSLNIGLSSAILLVVRQEASGELKMINEFIAITSLGEGLSESGSFSLASIDKTLVALNELRQISQDEGVDEMVVTAASAVKSANNLSSFLVKCRQCLNIFPQVLSGKEEASLTFLGATHDLPEKSPVVLIDIGGGATEIAYGTKDNLLGAESFNIGYVKLSENSKGKDRFSYSTQHSIQQQVRDTLLLVRYEIGDWATKNDPAIVISGGVAATYGAVKAKQALYDRDIINSMTSDKKELNAFFKKLSRMKIKDRLKIPGVEKERAEFIPTGLLILHTILTFFNFDKFRFSTNGLRLGTLKYFIEKNS